MKKTCAGMAGLSSVAAKETPYSKMEAPRVGQVAVKIPLILDLIKQCFFQKKQEIRCCGATSNNFSVGFHFFQSPLLLASLVKKATFCLKINEFIEFISEHDEKLHPNECNSYRPFMLFCNNPRPREGGA